MRQLLITGIICMLACHKPVQTPVEVKELTEQQKIHAYMDSVYMLPINKYIAH